MANELDRALNQRFDVMESGRSDFDLVVDDGGMVNYKIPRKPKTAQQNEPSGQPTLESESMNPFAVSGMPEDRESYGEFTETLASGTTGAVGGAAATTAGLPGDLVGLGQGIADAISAEEGERFASFLEGFAEVSNQIGSGKTLEIFQEQVDRLPVSDEAKSDILEGSRLLGEWAELPVGLKAIASGVRSYAAGAPARVADRAQGTTLSSGMDPTAPVDSAIVGAQRMMGGKGAAPNTPDVPDVPTPAVVARQAKEVAPASSGNKVKVEDAGQYLVEKTINQHGRKLDPVQQPEDLQVLIDEGTAEAAYQLNQPITGEHWYDDDVAEAFRQTSKVIPQLQEDEGLRVVMTALAGVTSPGTRAAQNWKNAASVMEEYLETGQISGRNPVNGKFFGGTRGPIIEKQLKLVEHLLNTKGVQGTADWLMQEHTVKELSDMRQQSGLYASGNKVPGKANDVRLGPYLFGEKVGPFILNLNGLKETTADVWFTRTYNRLTGQLFDTPDNSMAGAPRNQSERDIMKQWNRGIAENLGKDEQSIQAVLWYFEQQLYNSLGVKSARSEAFSDGAKGFVADKGLPTESVRGGDAPEVAGEQAGSAGAEQTAVRGQQVDTGSQGPEMGGDQ